MAFPRSFLSLEKFKLAFRRLVTSNKSDYKELYRHVSPFPHISV